MEAVAGGRARVLLRAEREPLAAAARRLRPLVLCGLALLLLWEAALAVPAPLEPRADPTDLEYTPRPEWYFLWLFQITTSNASGRRPDAEQEESMNRPALVTLAAAAALAWAAGAPAQEGGGFQNLQVLPKDISKDDLRATMDGFADQLDVKCSFCHVSDDYPNDEKEHKQVARRMLRLVLFMRENASQYFKDGINPQEINCWSCHRGKAEPEQWVPAE